MDVQLSRFTQLVFGYWMSGTVFGLVQSGVAELLDGGPRSGAEMAPQLDADPEVVESLCRAATAIGLVGKDGDAYSWSPLGARFLSAASADSLLNWVRIMGRWQEAWRDIGQAVVESGNGRRKAGRALEDDPGYERDMALGFFEFASLTSDAVAEALAIDEGLVIDVGSGPGAYSIAICKRSPDVRAALIDRPLTIAIAAELATREGLSDRIELHALDYLRDAYPTPADVVLISNMLHSEPAANRAVLYERAMDALVPGGRLVIHGHFIGAGGGVFTALQGLSSAVLWDVGGGITVEETLVELAAAGFDCDDPIEVKISGTVALVAKVK